MTTPPLLTDIRPKLGLGCGPSRWMRGRSNREGLRCHINSGALVRRRSQEKLMSLTAVRRALLAAFMLICVVSPSPASASAPHDRLEAGIVHEMNKVRAANGLPKLHSSGGLARAADAHSA